MSKKFRTTKGKAGRQEPPGQFRRSQVITTYGAGSMVDLLHDAALVSGIDFWRAPSHKWEIIQEPRLRDKIASKLLNATPPRYLSKEAAFRMPPGGDDAEPRWNLGIDALEFPSWFVCQNPECRAIVNVRSLERKGDRYKHDCTPKGVECVPVRFVSACPHGHLDEFPWVWFVHQGEDENERCTTPQLQLREGASGDFGSIYVKCTSCGASRGMSEAKDKESNPHCRGRRPWLGREGNEESCTERQHLLVRTASNSYFSQVESALSIPENERNIFTAIKSVWNIMQAVTPEVLPAFMLIPQVAAALEGFEHKHVLKAVDDIRDNRTPEPEALRVTEYREFVHARDEGPGDMPKRTDEFYVRKRLKPPPTNIANIVLAHKLREVRVQVGFTRLESVSPNLQGEFDIGVRSASLSLTADWLPAIEVMGEGVFIELDQEKIREWESRPAVIERGRHLLKGFELAMAERENAPEFPGMRFYLLHSLSHLLITALSLECGYSASAIRERIYCAPDTDPLPMAGILLSTGSPGTEGTLGGLVSEGRELEKHLRNALALGELCSNDPVCAMHKPEDRSERFLDGAACHGCLYVAESSCEWFNRYLDRALVVSTIGHDPELAFFSETP